MTTSEDRMVARYQAIRNARNLTDYEVARLAGIPRSTLYDWLRRGKANPGAGMSVEHVMALAQALEVEPLELIRGE